MKFEAAADIYVQNEKCNSDLYNSIADYFYKYQFSLCISQ